MLPISEVSVKKMSHSDSATSISTRETSPRTPDEKYHEYWEAALQAFGSTGDEGMMLNPAAQDGVSERDRHEIVDWLKQALSDLYLPPGFTSDLSDTSLYVERIIEIGAGNGRLSKDLQRMCKSLVAVDFIGEYIRENERRHGGADRSDDVFLEADARTLQYPDESMDVVFWNWLLMYFDETEVQSFIYKVMRWVKVGGLLFCRESCGGPSVSVKREWASSGNPSQYRAKETYTRLFQVSTVRGRSAGAEIQQAECSNRVKEATTTASDDEENQVVECIDSKDGGTTASDDEAHQVECCGGEKEFPVFEMIFAERPISVYSEKDSTGQCCWMLRRIA